VVLSAGVNFFISFVLFTGFLLLSDNFPGLPFLAFIPVLFIQVVFSVGLAVLLGVLNVFFRDVGQFYGIVLQFWFWFTPIVYPASILPEPVRRLLNLNPMATLVAAYQEILLDGRLPDWRPLAPVAAAGLVLCLFSWWLFKRHSGEMVDEL
jgi:lipopolysaccharide transport system permease protein